MFSLKGVWVKRFLFLLILGVGIALRLYKWNGYSFWYDEAQWITITLFQNNFLNLLKDTVWIGKPPAFRALLFFWRYLGQDEFMLRLLPFMFGILSILAIYKVGKYLFNEKVGLVASLLLSLSPFHIYYSQELTHYSLTMLLALYSIYYLKRSLRKNKISLWLKFILFTTLSLYTSYPFVFLLVSENIFFFFSYKRYKNLTKRWLTSHLAILLLYSPWLAIFPRQIYVLSVLSSTDWMPGGSLAYIFQALRIFNVGYNANFIVHLFASLLIFPLFLVGIFSNLNRERQKVKLLISWLFFPMILSILFSKIIHTFTYRNFIFTLPAYYLLVASGVIRLRRYIYVPIFSFIILSGFALYNYYKNIFPYPEEYYRPGVHAKKDNRAAVEYITKKIKEEDIVIHTSPSTAFPYIYYSCIFNSENIDKIRKLPLKKHKKTTYRWESFFVVKSEYKTKKLINSNKNIWLVLSFWEPQVLSMYPDMQENKVKKYLDESLFVIDYKEFAGIKVYLYKKQK